MLTDDEKFLFRQQLTIPDVKKFTRQNAADIIAVGFDVKKTFIFSDFDFMGGAFYENVVKVSRCITTNQAKSVFGFTDAYVPPFSESYVVVERIPRPCDSYQGSYGF